LGSKQKKKLTRGKKSFHHTKMSRLESMPVAILPYQTLLLVDDNAYLADVKSISGVNHCNA
jgi:hypothetical protein